MIGLGLGFVADLLIAFGFPPLYHEAMSPEIHNNNHPMGGVVVGAGGLVFQPGFEGEV